jgi:hypothetical protein
MVSIHIWKEVPMSMFDTNVKIAGQAPRAVCPLAT